MPVHSNTDGISQSTELFTLAQKNIASIGLAPTTSMGNLALVSNLFYRTFTVSILSTAAAQALPKMAGSGVLREANSRSMPFFSSFTTDGVNDEKNGRIFLVHFELEEKNRIDMDGNRIVLNQKIHITNMIKTVRRWVF